MVEKQTNFKNAPRLFLQNADSVFRGGGNKANISRTSAKITGGGMSLPSYPQKVKDIELLRNQILGTILPAN